MNDLETALKNLGVTDAWRLENIKNTAMSRFKVKKSRRPHIKRILDDAFQQLIEEDKMSIGGKVTDKQMTDETVSVNTNDGHEDCAVSMVRNADSEMVKAGDVVWWQSGQCYWTPKDKSRAEVKIEKVGYSFSWRY